MIYSNCKICLLLGDVYINMSDTDLKTLSKCMMWVLHSLYIWMNHSYQSLHLVCMCPPSPSPTHYFVQLCINTTFFFISNFASTQPILVSHQSTRTKDNVHEFMQFTYPKQPKFTYSSLSRGTASTRIEKSKNLLAQ